MTSPHTFHIPVMGLAFTIDTPVKVARFGISSVISIVEDNLIEKMREHYYKELNEPYHPITHHESDYRAKRITDYLNLIDRIVKNQVTKLRDEEFTPDSEITKYFEMLPEGSELKDIYNQMNKVSDGEDQLQLDNWLRDEIKPGRIDVNIMTKLDKNNLNEQNQVIEDGSDAVSALRGYAKSNLTNSSVILSAGMNPRLFTYLEKLTEFDADSLGNFKKEIVIKVSDYRSALIQGKMLAKKGLWVSEFRIESGLNCGGHAFASDGYLLGPILEEFKNKRSELIATSFDIYNQALKAKGKSAFDKPHQLRITVQGGIGTSEEDEFLRKHYEVDGTGWGTPFLLVPEATTVDANTLQLLSKAEEQDVVLSKNSPLGVRFYYLKGTTAEKEKMMRVSLGMPGSPCTEKYLVSNTEFGTQPICTASHRYQKKKIEQLQSLNLSKEEYDRQLQEVVDKECLCVGLSNAAVKEYALTPFSRRNGINVCPGPNIAYFSQVVSLKKMVDHIYGRANVLQNEERPHMFVKELTLYVDYWNELLSDMKGVVDNKRKAYVENFYQNLMQGISYYRNLAAEVNDELVGLRNKIESGLDETENRLKSMLPLIDNNSLAQLTIVPA
jgi:NAD(P)H-dependent flavin oxidoreductase YrpB (nitropropane dioxygenase family)